MKIGILDCELLPPHVEELEGSFGQMIERLLQAADPKIETITYAAHRGELPGDLRECEGYVCSGSKQSVYDEIDWILKLKDFVTRITGSGSPFVGICFGHQMIAEATGGKVEKSDKGWGLGVHEHQIVSQGSWLESESSTYKVLMSHQDQVVKLPEGAEVWSTSPHCRVSGFVIGKQFLGIQGHPEMSIQFADSLLDRKRKLFTEEEVLAARDTFRHSPDKLKISQWIVNFLRG